jgi:hypothetical protein
MDSSLLPQAGEKVTATFLVAPASCRPFLDLGEVPAGSRRYDSVPIRAECRADRHE